MPHAQPISFFAILSPAKYWVRITYHLAPRYARWWAHSRPKPVEKRNKHTKKNCAPSWLYLQDFRDYCVGVDGSWVFHYWLWSTLKCTYLYHDTVVYFQLNELGRILINVCNVVPAGIVCFFPSYEYENTVYEHWRKNEIISKLELKKKVSFMLLTSVKYSIVWLHYFNGI